MTAKFTNIQIEPELASWTALLRQNQFDYSRLDDLRRSARDRLIQSAEQFTTRLSGLAEEADLPKSGQPVLTGDPTNRPIVMTGHQPVVFHSGIAFKYATAEEFAASTESIGVAVLIDTDSGDAGQFSYPETPNPQQYPTLAIETLCTRHGLYLNSRLRDSLQLSMTADKVCEQLKQAGQQQASEQTADVLRGFSQLSATRVAATDANVIMRRQHGIGSRMLELPMSAIASFPEALRLTADILKQPHRFSAAYNSSLDLFREEHGIRNAANPFPNLRSDDRSCELPFWVISHNRGRRYVLEAEVDGNVTRLMADDKVLDSFTGNITAESLEPMLVQNIQIVPRGALITAFLRLLFSDLFVHGTGGGRYDRFTDELIRSWWNVEPPPFTVASASRFLFDRKRSELQRLNDIEASLRDFQFNPQRHFGAGVFESNLERRLAELHQRKESAVAQMKESHERGESAKDLGRTIQQLTNEIKAAVTAEFEPQLSVLKSVAPEQKDAVNCRTYPWFMFS